MFVCSSPFAEPPYHSKSATGHIVCGAEIYHQAYTVLSEPANSCGTLCRGFWDAMILGLVLLVLQKKTY